MSYLKPYGICVATIVVTGFFIINLANAAGNERSGADIFNGTCVACHGENGKGAFPGVPDFTAPKGSLSKPDTVLIDHIRNGFESANSDIAMPSLGGYEELSENEIKDVLAYIRSSFQHKM